MHKMNSQIRHAIQSSLVLSRLVWKSYWWSHYKTSLLLLDDGNGQRK